jgi:lipoate-protein ligase A
MGATSQHLRHLFFHFHFAPHGSAIITHRIFIPLPFSPMLCRLFHDSAASGAWNMAIDESLLVSAAEEGSCSLRFYAWEEPTLSLGYFQEYGDRSQHSASEHCPCVRRASGGGAILHDKEITYSFAAPPDNRWAQKHLQLYGAFHAALIETLASRNFPAVLCEKAGSERDHVQPFLCFQRRASGDVLVGEVKIAGSAQRRFGGAVVQHGSILFDRSTCAPELPGLNDLKRGVLPQEELLHAWMDKLAATMNFEFQPGILTVSEQSRAQRLTAEKYGSDGWNRHRGRG